VTYGRISLDNAAVTGYGLDQLDSRKPRENYLHMYITDRKYWHMYLTNRKYRHMYMINRKYPHMYIINRKSPHMYIINRKYDEYT